MKHTVRYFALLVGAGLLSLALVGCKRAPALPKKEGADGAKDQTDIFKSTNETFRYTAGTNDDWTRFRDGFAPLHSYFNKPDVASRLRFSTDDRKFLVGAAHLSEAEFAEIDAPYFRRRGRSLSRRMLFAARRRPVLANRRLIGRRHKRIIISAG